MKHDKADQSHSESEHQSEAESAKRRQSPSQRSAKPASPQKQSDPAATSSPHPENAAVKVNRWNGQELRVALDDLLTKFMNQRARFEQVDTALNCRILVALGKNLAGLWTLYASCYFKPFPTARPYLLVGVLAYALVIALSWLAMWKGLLSSVVYQGRRAGVFVELMTALALPQPAYEVTLFLRPDAQRSKQPVSLAVHLPFNRWISEHGEIDEAAFFSCLDNELLPKVEGGLK